MAKRSTYATITPLLTDYLSATDDPAGTPLTRNILISALQTLLEANLVGAYGCLGVEAGATGEATVDATPRKIAAWNVDGLSSGTTPDEATGNDITINVAGTYFIQANISFSGDASDTYQVEIYKNGVATGFALDRKLGTGGDVGNAACGGIVACVATDTIELYQSSSTGGVTLTVTEATLAVTRIAA